MSSSSSLLDQINNLDSSDDSDSIGNIDEKEFIEPAQDLFTLDELLQESMAAHSEKAKYKQLRKDLAEGKISQEHRSANEALLREWEERREWVKAADVIGFERSRCTSCGQFHTIFMGYFERQDHKLSKSCSRRIAVTKLSGALPKEVFYLDHDVPLCEDCADILGFPVEE